MAEKKEISKILSSYPAWIVAAIAVLTFLYPIYRKSSDKVEIIEVSNIKIDFSYNPKSICEVFLTSNNFSKEIKLPFRTVSYPLTFNYIVSNNSEVDITLVNGSFKYLFKKYFRIPLSKRLEFNYKESGIYDENIEYKVQFPIKIEKGSSKAFKILVNIPILSYEGIKLLDEKEITLDTMVFSIQSDDSLKNALVLNDQINLDDKLLSKLDSTSTSAKDFYALMMNEQLFKEYELKSSPEEIFEHLIFNGFDVFGRKNDGLDEGFVEINFESQKGNHIESELRYVEKKFHNVVKR